MIENGLKYYDSRIATEEEFTDDLSVSALSDSTQKTKGGPVLFRKDGKIYTDPSDLHNLIVGKYWINCVSWIRAAIDILICYGGRIYDCCGSQRRTCKKNTYVLEGKRVSDFGIELEKSTLIT